MTNTYVIIIKEINKIINNDYRKDQIFTNKDINNIYKKLHLKMKNNKKNIEFNDIHKYLVKSFKNTNSFEFCENIKTNSSIYIPSYNIDE